MPHLNDPKLAAQLLSGISFTINHTSRGDFSLQHVKAGTKTRSLSPFTRRLRRTAARP